MCLMHLKNRQEVLKKEFIFVNDGSSDNSLELLRSLTKGWKKKIFKSKK